MALVTISVVSHGHGPLVAALLGDLSRQSVADQIDVVLTLNIPESAANASQSFAPLNIRVIRNERPRGFGTNHNTALESASTPWVIVINPDIRIDDDALIEKLVQCPGHAQVGLVAPLIRNSRGQREDFIRHNLDPISLFSRAVLRRTETIDPDQRNGRFRWVAGMFLAMPLAAWRVVGGFDERFFLYCEDYDLCARMAMRGYAIHVSSKVEAIHNAQRSSRSSVKYLKWHIASLLRVWRSKHFWRIWFSDWRYLLTK